MATATVHACREAGGQSPGTLTRLESEALQFRNCPALGSFVVSICPLEVYPLTRALSIQSTPPRLITLSLQRIAYFRAPIRLSLRHHGTTFAIRPHANGRRVNVKSGGEVFTCG